MPFCASRGGCWRRGRRLLLGVGEGAASPPLPAGTRKAARWRLPGWGPPKGREKGLPRPWHGGCPAQRAALDPARSPAARAAPPHLGSGRAIFLLARAAGELRLFSMAMR